MDEVYHATQITSKVCSKCGIEKPLEEFYRSTRGIGGRRGECKICHQNPHIRIVQAPLFIFEKVCTKCSIEKPLDQFGPYKKGIYGVRAVCNECRKAESSEYYARRYGLKREPLPEPVNGGKVCRRCKQEKSPDQFPPDKRASDGHGSQCKKCMAEVQIPHAERNQANSRKKWEENGAKYRQTHKEWRKKNPDRLRELRRRRDARKRKAQTAPVSYKRIRERDEMWCYICEQPIYPGQRTAFDHVIPLVPRKGATCAPGAHSEDNIKITHYLCNARKGQKLIEEMTPYDRRGIKKPQSA